MGTPVDAEMGSESGAAYRLVDSVNLSLPPPRLVENLR